MTRWIVLIAVLLSPFAPTPSRAWGTEGHQIIADIAEAHLTPETARRVSEIIQGARMRDVSMYADDIRPFRRDTSRWHFVNIEIGAGDYQPVRDCQLVPGQGDCIIAAIARNRADVKANGPQQNEALKFLIHFMGDLHQPFHCVTEARGGNEIRVTFRGRSSNLHRVWDSDLIQAAGRSSADYAQWLLENWIKGREVAELAKGDTVSWALQSRALGQMALVLPNANLGDTYIAEFMPVIDQQLALAGIRLAQILNAALSK